MSCLSTNPPVKAAVTVACEVIIVDRQVLLYSPFGSICGT